MSSSWGWCVAPPTCSNQGLQVAPRQEELFEGGIKGGESSDSGSSNRDVIWASRVGVRLRQRGSLVVVTRVVTKWLGGGPGRGFGVPHLARRRLFGSGNKCRVSWRVPGMVCGTDVYKRTKVRASLLNVTNLYSAKDVQGNLSKCHHHSKHE